MITPRTSLKNSLIHVAILITFFLIPMWYRLPYVPLAFTKVYVSRFLILLAMLATVLLWLIFGLQGLRAFAKRRLPALWGVMLLALAGWGFLSLQWAFIRMLHPDVGYTAALQFGAVSLFVIVVACSGISPRAVILTLTLSLMINAIITLLQVNNQGWLGLQPLGEFRFFNGSEGVSILRAGELMFVRPYGLLPHPNLLAGSLILGCMAAGAWIIAAGSRWRWIGVIALPLGVWALLLTFSRAAWGGFAVGTLFLLPFVVRHVWRERRLLIPLAAAVILALIFTVNFVMTYRPFLAARAGQVEESIEMRSIADRLVFIDFALRSVQERPILGVGIGNFPWRASYYISQTFYDLRGDNVHNVYLSAWAELGTVGLILQVSAILFGVIAAWRIIRESQGDERITRAALLAIFLALAAVGWLDHYPYSILHFQVVWWGSLAVALGRS